MTAILGISAFYHDSAAALVVDGEIVAAAQEERFTRKKHDPGFPAHAVALLPRAGRARAGAISTTSSSTRSRCGSSSGCSRRTSRLRRPASAAFGMAMPVWLKEKTAPAARSFAKALGGASKAPIVFTDHHESHAASAFFPSPFDEAAILTLDGVGEWSTTTMRRRPRATRSS